MIIPIDKNGDIWMVRQHRYTIDMITLELPSGGTDEEDYLFAAKRELEEETSLVSDKWEKIGELYESNGLANIRAQAFVAYDVEIINNPRKDPLDKDVFEVENYSIAQIKEMIIKGKINDGPTISAFSMAFFQGKLDKYLK